GTFTNSRVFDDPGSAVPRFTLHRVRETLQAKESRSRGASQRPSYGKPLSEIVATDFTRCSMRSCGRPNAGGSMASAALARMTKVRTNENVGGETPTDARLFCRGIGHGRAPRRRGAHLSAFHRGSPPQGVFHRKGLSLRPGFLGRGGTRFAYPLSGRYPPRPVPKSSVPHAPRS